MLIWVTVEKSAGFNYNAVNDSGTSKCCHSVYNGDDEEKEHCKSAACYG